MQDKLVSIIIPTYNKAQLVVKTLQSISEQTYQNWECIIVDDGSDEKDFLLIKNYTDLDSKFQLHKRPLDKPKGANTCRNYGISLSKGTYFQFFDSDDLMLPFCLEGRIDQMIKNDYDFVVFSMGIIKDDGYVKDSKDVIVQNWQEALHAFISDQRLPWNLQRTLYKSELIKHKINFNEKLLRFQDVEFHIKLLSKYKPKFKIVSIIDCSYRKASASNPRSNQFHQNVFISIPEFFNSISKYIPKDVLNTNISNLQHWLYIIVSLYTTKAIPNKMLQNVIASAKKNIKLTFKQSLMLKLLFFGKKYFVNVKGETYFFDLLKKVYKR
ncbi:glycosyltransferase family 2 protein [Olleya sp. R77988]|uniref:glycosyltransferase family 2 protein n=1 Tax=Olleya sp. R77988 TaxID=3093875 RepID=UPI0037CC90F1